MSQVVTRKPTQDEFCAEAIKLRQISSELQELYAPDELGLAPEIEEAKLREFEQAVRHFKNLRSTLSEREVFLAEHHITTAGDPSVEHSREVSLILPRGCSRIEFLCEVQDLSQAAVHLTQLGKWAEDESFTKECEAPTRVRIVGHLEGSSRLIRSEQQKLLEERGLAMPSIADLAVAHAAYFLATGQCIFGSTDHEKIMARADRGALCFYDSGLYAADLLGAVSRRAAAGKFS